MPPNFDGRPLAHGLATLTSLPVPTRYVVVGAAVVLAVSFAVLAFAWRSPRFGNREAGWAFPNLLSRSLLATSVKAGVVALALLFAAWITMAAFFGPDVLVNPAFGVAYAVLWVGLVPAALIFGEVYRLCNPLRWIYRALCKVVGKSPAAGLFAYPSWLGMWPAATGLLAFTWLELANPDYSTSLPILRAWFLMLAAVPLACAALFGEEAFAKADAFEVYSSLVARLSPFRRTPRGRLVAGNPLANLETTTSTAGLVGVVSVLFGSTVFDSFHGTVRYFTLVQNFTDHLVLVSTVGLLLFCAAVLATFSGATALTGEVGGLRRRDMPQMLAHSVVPIVVGYVVAHYFTFLLSVGMQTLQRLGDPLGRGWALTDFAGSANAFWIYYHTTAIWTVQVSAVVVGHVLGVVAAHNRCITLLPARKAVTGQLPMLALMIVYTTTGLFFLFSS